MKPSGITAIHKQLNTIKVKGVAKLAKSGRNREGRTQGLVHQDMSICFISYHYLRLNLSFSNKCQLYSKFTKSAWERVVMPDNTTLILSIGVDHCCFSNDQYCSVDFSTMNIRRNNSKHWVLFVIITKRNLSMNN